jgi:hypothetical protein
MFSIRNSLVAVAAIATFTGAAAAETLVVRSSGPSARLYPPGKSLPDGAAVALKAGDQRVLLDGRGTRVVRGPTSFNPAATAASPETGARLAALVGGGSDRRVRIGAVRGVGEGKPHSPNIWYVDAGKSGTVCVADPSAVTLWRPRMDAETTLSIVHDGKAATPVMWPAGSNTLAWPAALPVSQGAAYTLTMPGAAPVKLRFAVVGTRPQGLEDTASLLIRDGCSSQLDLLVDTFSLPGSPAG